MSANKGPFVHVVGVVGLKAAGKGVFCDRLREQGYTAYRLSDAVRNAMLEEAGNSAPSVTQMQDFSNRKKRETGDYGIWGSKVLELAQKRGCRKVLLDGIRNPAEIDAARRVAGSVFALVGIVAPIEVRAERFIKRGQAGDPLELMKFLQVDDRDRGVGEQANGQLVDRCLAQVPFANLYNNAGSLQEFHDWTDATICHLLHDIGESCGAI
jgi:dephospho-CoA kinase